MEDATKRFTTVSNQAQIREILSSVYDSLVLKGYNPINQLVGYILSEDPTYITNYNNARSLICRIDRDELLEELVRSYLEKDCPRPGQTHTAAERHGPWAMPLSVLPGTICRVDNPSRMD